MRFQVQQKVLFKHCDPAGIVFYPRYFEMLNDAVEALFADALGWPFEAIHRGEAVPTVSLEAEFPAPSRHGDLLEFTLSASLGRTSMTIETDARCGGEARMRARQVLVYVDARGAPKPWPDPVRTTFKEAAT